MTDRRSIDRRGFVKICTSALTMLGMHPQILANEPAAARKYNRVKLVRDDGNDLHLVDLAVGESFVFHYPYVSTPCFLINLGQPTNAHAALRTEDGQDYNWPGGVGPHRSVVAFSAICAHRMSHPSPTVSFINYRHESATFLDADEQATERARVIYCCSEKSVYDPTEGGRVLGGPAKQPLAAIDLSHDVSDDCLYANGSFGGEMFDKFLEKFGFRLALELKTDRIHDPVTDTTTVLSLDSYCEKQVVC